MLRIKCSPLYFTGRVLLILRIKSSELNDHRRNRIFLLRIEPKHRSTKLEIHLLPNHEPVKIEEPRKIEKDKLNKGTETELSTRTFGDKFSKFGSFPSNQFLSLVECILLALRSASCLCEGDGERSSTLSIVREGGCR